MLPHQPSAGGSALGNEGKGFECLGSPKDGLDLNSFRRQRREVIHNVQWLPLSLRAQFSCRAQVYKGWSVLVRNWMFTQ